MDDAVVEALANWLAEEAPILAVHWVEWKQREFAAKLLAHLAQQQPAQGEVPQGFCTKCGYMRPAHEAEALNISLRAALREEHALTVARYGNTHKAEGCSTCALLAAEPGA